MTEKADDCLHDLLVRARSLWLSKECDLTVVEELYRKVFHAASCTHPSKKRRCDFSSEERKAGEKLALLYLQSNRCAEADVILRKFGYKCRLAHAVFEYPMEIAEMDKSFDIPCRIWDGFLDENELETLQDVFGDVQGDYWTSHCYSVEPPSSYFSYVVPLTSLEEYGVLGGLISRLKNLLIDWFPSVASCSYCEFWAHNRPHPTGHQFHFDSDNEGEERIRNPIVTAIVYLSNAGSPSVVTNQRLASRSVAQTAWLAFPSIGRLVAFDGKVLHGVLPGRGVDPNRRVTLMLAFWRRIRVRDGTQPGAARPVPRDTKWAKTLFRPISRKVVRCQPIPSDPCVIRRVYETTIGGPWTKDMGMPNYDEVFQGF